MNAVHEQRRQRGNRADVGIELWSSSEGKHATALNDWGMGSTAGDGGVLHGKCTKFCLTIRILGWDYLT